jgi:hypothetical protein
MEVALALAILSFAAIGIMGLTSSGLGNYRQIMDTTVSAQIAQRVIYDAEQADYQELTGAPASSAIAAAMEKDGKTFSFRAPSLEHPAFRYFDEQGKEIVPKDDMLTPSEKRSIVYWVNTRITPRPRFLREDGKPIETATLAVEVASNPSGVDLNRAEYLDGNDRSPRYHLLTPPAGVKVFTYTALIGRSE